MKAVILAGGHGIRLAEETVIKPKPMVEIGGYPILWHIMKLYAHFGFKDFIIALGYKGEVIKDYFLNYHPANSEITVELGKGLVEYHSSHDEDWTVHLMDTGLNTLTGGRLRRMENHLRKAGTFLTTYGDGICDVNIGEVLEFHKRHGKLATITAVRPPARFGTMKFNGDQVINFKEKYQTGEGWINGGFFVFEPGIFDYLEGDDTILERKPLEQLAADGQLMAYKHEGFWRCMDTLRDKLHLQEMWENEAQPWRIWD